MAVSPWSAWALWLTPLFDVLEKAKEKRTMKHITKVSVMKAENCSADDVESIINGLQGADPLACIGQLLVAALDGDKDKDSADA